MEPVPDQNVRADVSGIEKHLAADYSATPKRKALSVVCWKWAPQPGYRSTYTADTVHVLRNMVRRHYTDPHRFICVTDDPAGLDPDVEVVPLWNDYADLQHPSNYLYPSCYRRLKAFSPEIRSLFGKRFVSLDLDCVIVDDLRPIWNRREDFVAWGGTTSKPNSVNGSMFLMTAGARAQVWTNFHPVYSPKHAKDAGFYGSDQAWIGYCLSSRCEARWTTADGVYSYRMHVAPYGGRMPPGARIVFWNGKKDPWGKEAQGLDWVCSNYR